MFNKTLFFRETFFKNLKIKEKNYINTNIIVSDDQRIHENRKAKIPNINPKAERAKTTAVIPKLAFKHFFPDLSQSHPALQSIQ